jgi:hypothetical protein
MMMQQLQHLLSTLLSNAAAHRLAGMLAAGAPQALANACQACGQRYSNF